MNCEAQKESGDQIAQTETVWSLSETIQHSDQLFDENHFQEAYDLLMKSSVSARGFSVWYLSPSYLPIIVQWWRSRKFLYLAMHRKPILILVLLLNCPKRTRTTRTDNPRMKKG